MFQNEVTKMAVTGLIFPEAAIDRKALWNSLSLQTQGNILWVGMLSFRNNMLTEPTADAWYCVLNSNMSRNQRNEDLIPSFIFYFCKIRVPR